jgi:hypothetical protein
MIDSILRSRWRMVSARRWLYIEVVVRNRTLTSANPIEAAMA